MINIRHMKKFLVIIILSLLQSNYSFADKKFDKDLKKVSKDNGLIEKNGKIYSIDNISDKKNTILVIYSHGSQVDQKIDKCLSEHNRVPKVIRNLHNQKIKNFTIVIYRLCSGVKGWSDKEQTKMWKAHKKLGNLDLKIKDKNGTILISKQKQNRKRKIIKDKVESLRAKGFENIVLAGHSSGGWQSIKLKVEFSNLIQGVIGLHPGAGGTVQNREDWPWWTNVRYYNFAKDLSKLNALIITHDKDIFNSPEDYSMFRNLSKVKFVNLTSSKCKKKAALGGYHGLALTECFAGDPKSKDIIKYLENIF